ncbi:hypothetical protein MASR1M60_31570 [Rhodocyclaceae bacterium]
MNNRLITPRLLPLFFSVSFCTLVYAGDWTTDQKGCKSWNQNPGPGETITWSGQCKDGYATGKGVQQWFINGKPTDRYEGEMLNGYLHGKGTYIWSDSNKNCGTAKCAKKFVGEWGQGRRVCGRNEFFGGDTYEGCHEPDGTMKGKTKFELAEENQRYSRLDKCQHLYQGRVFKRENFFGHLNYIVVGFSPSQGRATVKAEHDGSLSEISCRDVPE